MELNIFEKILKKKIIKSVDKSSYFYKNYVLITKDKKYFVKLQKNQNLDLINEAKELSILGKYVKTPIVHCATKEFIIMDWIEKSHNLVCQNQLGESLAILHNNQNKYYGFQFNNKLGITTQLNAPEKKIKNWADFFWNYRINFQITLAKKNNLISCNENEKLLILKNYVYRKLDIKTYPSLLHGDLWSGNYISNSNGPFFIDSAAYFGHREADFALTYMFGGFSREFYQSYEKRLPFEENHEERKPIYMIYHYLNHLNLFGRSYLSGVLNCYQKIIN